MNQMTYENYRNRQLTVGMRFRAIGQSEDMIRYANAKALVESVGRPLEADDGGTLDSAVRLVVKSKNEEPLKLPNIDDAPDELKELLGSLKGQLVEALKGKKAPAKVAVVKIHPRDFDRVKPRVTEDVTVLPLLPKELFLPVESQPDHWRAAHPENPDAWIEFEFLGPIDMSVFGDELKSEVEEPDEAAVSAANELFAKLGSDAPKH